MDRRRLIPLGLALLAPAALVAAVRALLAVAGVPEPPWYWVLFAIGGPLSGIGMLLVAAGTWGTPRFWWVAAGVASASVGHYVLPWLGRGSDASLVHLGTGLTLLPWSPWALVGGVAAGLGAALRPDPAGNVLLAVGAVAMAAFAFGAGWRSWRESDAPAPGPGPAEAGQRSD